MTRDGMEDAANTVCGNPVVTAQSADATARLFEDHPHITLFPGYGIDIMPFVT